MSATYSTTEDGGFEESCYQIRSFIGFLGHFIRWWDKSWFLCSMFVYSNYDS